MKTLSIKNKKYAIKNKKYSKKGGIFFTRTTKYKDVKKKKETLQEVVESLEIQLSNCKQKLQQCVKKYPGGEYPMRGGIFGLSLASNYNRLKSEKIGLEERITHLNAAIEECNNELFRCEKLTEERHTQWNKSMSSVIEKGNQILTSSREYPTSLDTEETMRPTEPVITPFAKEEFERTQELANQPQNFGGKKRKTKKANIKRKKCSYRRR